MQLSIMALCAWLFHSMNVKMVTTTYNSKAIKDPTLSRQLAHKWQSGYQPPVIS
jgi:hypothetical protein